MNSQWSKRKATVQLLVWSFEDQMKDENVIIFPLHLRIGILPTIRSDPLLSYLHTLIMESLKLGMMECTSW